MHIELGTLMILSALISALVLALDRGNRVVPLVAVIAAALAAAIHFGVLSLSLAKFRIDVILPAIFVVTGGISWARTTTKGATTAATVLFAVGAMMLLGALRLLG
jgi:hypothetical protein